MSPPCLLPRQVSSSSSSSASSGSVSAASLSSQQPTTIATTRPRGSRLLPGKTAKLHARHFVVHNYHDYAAEGNEDDDAELETSSADVETMVSSSFPNTKPGRGGVLTPFPLKLHQVLTLADTDEADFAHIISWQPHGRCFVIHKPKLFVEYVMPRYFNQTKLTSFQRQLNLYGFQRLTRGPDASGYYHECFLRGKPSLTSRLQRTRVKGTKVKGASSPDQEPNFYEMSALVGRPGRKATSGSVSVATAPSRVVSSSEGEEEEEEASFLSSSSSLMLQQPQQLAIATMEPQVAATTAGANINDAASWQPLVSSPRQRQHFLGDGDKISPRNFMDDCRLTQSSSSSWQLKNGLGQASNSTAAPTNHPALPWLVTDNDENWNQDHIVEPSLSASFWDPVDELLMEFQNSSSSNSSHPSALDQALLSTTSYSLPTSCGTFTTAAAATSCSNGLIHYNHSERQQPQPQPHEDNDAMLGHELESILCDPLFFA